MTTRTQVADYLASELPKHRSRATLIAAAWLIETKRTRQAEYLARDVSRLSADNGYLLLAVTTAKPLSAEARAAITSYALGATSAKQVELAELVDPGVIGGVKLETPTARLDATIATRLASFVAEANR
jgi:F0F1-type ATP synthase delta subunit